MLLEKQSIGNYLMIDVQRTISKNIAELPSCSKNMGAYLSASDSEVGNNRFPVHQGCRKCTYRQELGISCCALLGLDASIVMFPVCIVRVTL